MQQSKLRTVSPIQCQYVSTPSNCSVGGAFKRSKTLKTQSPYSSQHKESLNCIPQIEPNNNKNRCKEISIEVAKFLSQINKKESNFPYMYSSIVGFDNKNHEESLAPPQQQLQQLNQSLKKQSEIKQQEIDQWKQKYEQTAKYNNLVNKYDEDIKILSQEIQAVNERITSCEQQRNYSFFDQKATGDNLTNMSIQTFQRSINENENFIEQNKLLDEISEKNTIIKSLTMTLDKTKMEISEAQIRSNREIEQLKNKISQFQQQKMKMEFSQDPQIQNIKVAYDNQVQILKEQINQLKCLIEIKNQEIQTIGNQNQRLKHQIDQENNTLKQENQTLKQQLIKNEKQYQEDINQLKSNYSLLQQNQIFSIKSSSKKQITDLETEIKDNNNTKQQQLIVDRLLQREHYNVENQRLNSIIEEQNKQLLSQRQQPECINIEQIKKFQDLQIQCQILLEETNQKMEQINRENTSLKNEIVYFKYISILIQQELLYKKIMKLIILRIFTKRQIIIKRTSQNQKKKTQLFQVITINKRDKCKQRRNYKYFNCKETLKVNLNNMIINYKIKLMRNYNICKCQKQRIKNVQTQIQK